MKLKAFIHDLESINWGNPINTIIMSPEAYEDLRGSVNISSAEIPGFLGVSIYLHKHLGDVIVYGNREKLDEMGFIQNCMEAK